MSKISRILENRITPRKIMILCWIVLLSSIIPLVWIGFYNHPSADDFSESLLIHRAWRDSHNIFKTVFVAASKSCKDYFEWMGYFTSNFLMSIAPSLFGERVYVITTPLLLGLFIVSTRYMFKQIFVKAIGMNKYYAESIICVIIFVLIQCMVASGRTEMFYWYCSGANYTMTHSMCMFFFGLLISFYYNNDSSKVKKGIKLVGISVLGFFVGGGNMLTALNSVLIVVFMNVAFAVEHKYGKIKNCTLLIIPSIFNIYGLMCSVFSPGNDTRKAITSGMSPIKAILVSFYDYLSYCIDEWLTWPIVLMLLLLVPIYWKGLQKCKYKFRYPLLIVVLGYGITSAMFTPSLYAVGNVAAGRLQAIAYIMFIMTLFLSEGYVIGYFSKKILFENYEEIFSDKETIFMAFIVIFIAFSSILTIIPDNHYFAYSSALTDIVNGSAKEYSDALYRRVDAYTSGEKNIVVYKLPTEPKLLYFADLEGNYNEWARDAICRYYDLESLECVDPEDAK